MIGWDFLFSVAYTTPCSAVASSPMPGAPPTSATPELRNRWGTISKTERLKYMTIWWNTLPHVLPFKAWRVAWNTHVPKRPSLDHGRRAVTLWLYKAEKAMCNALKETAPHNTYSGLCAELATFSSGCGKRNLKAKTCRAVKKHARNTLKTRRTRKYRAVGGFL